MTGKKRQEKYFVLQRHIQKSVFAATKSFSTMISPREVED